MVSKKTIEQSNQDLKNIQKALDKLKAQELNAEKSGDKKIPVPAKTEMGL